MKTYIELNIEIDRDAELSSKELDRVAELLSNEIRNLDVEPILSVSYSIREYDEDDDIKMTQHERSELDEDYERAAARARGNDFIDTDGKDWT